MTLSDLLKQRSTVKTNQKKFKLPCIFGQNTSNATELPSAAKFNKLSELANAHLSSTIKKNDTAKFFPCSISQNVNEVKNLNESPNSVLNDISQANSTHFNLTPHEISLQKIMDFRRLDISSTKAVSSEKLKCIVDLQFAVNSSKHFNTDSLPLERVKMVDCNPISQLNSVLTTPRVDQFCLLKIHLPNRTKQATPLGKILCSRYKQKRQTYVQLSFQPKHKIIPFLFDI